MKNKELVMPKKAGEKVLKEEKTQKSEPFSQIGKKSFFLVVSLLLFLLFLCWILTYVIPQGAYQRDDEGMIIADTFTHGPAKGIAAWRVLTAPFRVFASGDGLTVIMISIFLLVMSGIFNLLEKTNGTKVIISKTVRKFADKKKLVVCIAAFVFMAFGSLFGMFEELVTLLPLVIVFMLSMGFDTMTGLGVCMLAACFGFSAAITNPFSVGMVADIAGTSVLDGVWMRILFFGFIYAVVCGFLLLHIKKISLAPEKSLSFKGDQRKLLQLDLSMTQEVPKERKIFITYVVFFSVQLVALVAIAAIRAIADFAIPILAASFLIGGIVCGLIVCERKVDVFKYIGQGAVGMLPAVVMIALASSVKLVMEESGILDSVMYGVIKAFNKQHKVVCVILIYFLILLLQVFIGSSSAKIMLIMPIILPIATELGLSANVIILTYCIADGFTDMILPTNPVLLVGLSMANVSYGKWVKWTWKLQLLLFMATILLLMLAVQIGY
jgi:uncharacterized ion transporter superfamily protein YfcC